MNYYYKNTCVNPHNICSPNKFRMLIFGSLGSGKTTLLMKLLLEKNLIDYDKLYIFVKSLYQAEYRVIQSGFEIKLSKSNNLKLLNPGDEIKDEKYWEQYTIDDIPTIESVAAAVSTLQKKPSKLEAKFHNSADEIPDPADLNKSIRNFMIFDDIMSETKIRIHHLIISQEEDQLIVIQFTQVKIIQNCLYTLLDLIQILWYFLNLHHYIVVEQLFRSYASLDMSLDEFRDMCKKICLRSLII